MSSQRTNNLDSASCDCPWTRALLAIGILAVFVLVLHAMGRTAWYTSGFGLWTGDAWSSRTSQDFADPYSFTHVLHGIIFYWLLTILAGRLSVRQRFMLAVLIEMGWEILENSPMVIDRYRSVTASLDYYGDSILNSLGDIFSCTLGFWLAARLPVKATLAVVVAIELGLLIAIRDNLTLNVIMLICPIDAVRNWQVGGL